MKPTTPGAFGERAGSRGTNQSAHIAAIGNTRIIIEVQQGDGGVKRWETLGGFAGGVQLEQTPVYDNGAPSLRRRMNVDGSLPRGIPEWEPDNMIAMDVKITGRAMPSKGGGITQMVDTYPTIQEQAPEPSMACTSETCKHAGQAPDPTNMIKNPSIEEPTVDWQEPVQWR